MLTHNLQPISNGRTCSQGTRHPTFNFIIQISTNVLLLSLSVTSMQLAPTMMGLTSVLARMDFLVTGKLAKVGKVVSQINFWCKFYQDLDSFATPKEHSSSPHVGESRFRNPWNFDCGIQNTGQGIRNPTKDWNSESRFHWQRLESSTWNQESTAWNPESNTVLDSLTWGKFFKLNP